MLPTDSAPLLLQVDEWAQKHFGLTLANYPSTRGDQLVEMLRNYPPATWDDLADDAARILSIPETHFQRHPECFVALSDLLRQVAKRRPTGPIRLWSAGCASGEEVYNLAAVGRQVVGDRIEVHGTDFSEEAIGKARKGVYGRWSLRGLAIEEMDWLQVKDDGQVCVVPEVAARVQFERGTLAEPGPPYQIDVAFCRNVLIYFCDQGSGRVLQRIAKALRPEGVLIMAPTDPVPTELGRWTQIQVEAPRPVRAYRPPEDTERSAGEPVPDSTSDIASSIRKLLGS